MKILHLLNHSFPLLDGYTSRSQNIVKTQKEMGFYPVVLTSPKHEADLKKACPKKEVIDGVDFYRTGKNRFAHLPLICDLFQMCLVFIRLAGVIKTEKPDIIHAHSPVLNGFPAWLVGKTFCIPVVYEIRAFWEDAGVDQATYKEQSLKYRLVKFFETWICHRVAQVAVLCQGIKNDLASRGVDPGKMTPVYNGIRPENFKPYPPDQEFSDAWQLSGKRVIGFIGSFYRYEGLDLLVEAFSRLASQYPDINLLLVGGGEMEERLKEQVKTLGIEDRTVMPGRVPHNRVDGVYALIDILVYPRYSVRLTELVTPLKPLEAMAMKKVLIASDIGGHRELISHNRTGLLFKAGDVQALSDAIIKCLSDETLAQRLRQNGHEYVMKNKTWLKTIAVHKLIYTSM
mgnify:CR=1 FL=1